MKVPLQILFNDGHLFVCRKHGCCNAEASDTALPLEKMGNNFKALKDIEDVVRVLREREREGEGARFDRIRTERERAELLAELELVRAEVELDRARMLAFLPPDTPIDSVSGQIETTVGVLDAGALVPRALGARED